MQTIRNDLCSRNLITACGHTTEWTQRHNPTVIATTLATEASLHGYDPSHREIKPHCTHPRIPPSPTATASKDKLRLSKTTAWSPPMSVLLATFVSEQY